MTGFDPVRATLLDILGEQLRAYHEGLKAANALFASRSTHPLLRRRHRTMSTTTQDPAAIAAALLADPAPATVTTVAQGRQRVRRARLTGQEIGRRREDARAITGYGPTSPIWGMTTAQITTDILGRFQANEARTLALFTAIDRGEVAEAARLYNDLMEVITGIRETVGELQKREATNTLTFAR